MYNSCKLSAGSERSRKTIQKKRTYTTERNVKSGNEGRHCQSHASRIECVIRQKMEIEQQLGAYTDGSDFSGCVPKTQTDGSTIMPPQFIVDWKSVRPKTEHRNMAAKSLVFVSHVFDLLFFNEANSIPVSKVSTQSPRSSVSGTCTLHSDYRYSIERNTGTPPR